MLWGCLAMGEADIVGWPKKMRMDGEDSTVDAEVSGLLLRRSEWVSWPDRLRQQHVPRSPARRANTGQQANRPTSQRGTKRSERMSEEKQKLCVETESPRSLPAKRCESNNEGAKKAKRSKIPRRPNCGLLAACVRRLACGVRAEYERDRELTPQQHTQCARTDVSLCVRTWVSFDRISGLMRRRKHV